MPFKIPPIPTLDTRVKRLILKTVSLSFLVILVVGISWGRVCDPYENVLLDWRFRLRPVQPVEEKIVIIEISDDTLKQLGYWPLPRDFHASLIDVLTDCGVRQVMFDIIFTDKAAQDSTLEDAIKQAGNIYLPYVLQLDDDSRIKKTAKAKQIIADVLPDFANSAQGLGHINAYRDSDGKTRWVPLVLNLDGKLKIHMALRMACDLFNLPLKNIVIEKQRLRIDNHIVIPTAYQGAMLVNYAGPWHKTFRHYSYVDILAAWNEKSQGKTPRVNLEGLKDAICFIGLTATGTADLQSMPLQNDYPMVGLHANIINSILLKRFLLRADPAVNLFILIVLLAVVFAVTRQKRTKPVIAFLATVGYGILFSILAVLLFTFQGVWIDVFYPLVMMLFMNSGMSLYHFLEENRRSELVEKELSIAKRIQESFLPKVITEFRGLEISANMLTAKHVGGDLYDMCELGRDHVGIFIGDVSGKGVPAALVMAKTVSLFRMLSLGAEEPSDLLFQLNEEMVRNGMPGIFVTATYIIYSSDDRKVMIASAGHLPTFVLRNKSGQVESIQPKEGMPLGIMERVEFSQNETTLEQGDKIILYTDGIVEAKNLDRQDFGEERFLNLLKRSKDKKPKEIVDAINKDIQNFIGKAPQHDDCTLIILNERSGG